MNEMEKSNVGKQWTCLEDLYYHFSLILNQHILDSNKKATHFFVEIRRLLNKSAEQCRTHHDKKMNDFKEKVHHKRRDHYLVYKFYYENIKIRKLDEAHLRKEILHFLEETLNPTEEDSKLYKEYVKRLDISLKKLELDKNSSELFQRAGKYQQQQSPQESISLPQESQRQQVQQIIQQSQANIPEPFYEPLHIYYGQGEEQNSFFQAQPNSNIQIYNQSDIN